MVKHELIADRLRDVIKNLCEELRVAADVIRVLEEKTNDHSDHAAKLEEIANDALSKLYR